MWFVVCGVWWVMCGVMVCCEWNGTCVGSGGVGGVVAGL